MTSANSVYKKGLKPDLSGVITRKNTEIWLVGQVSSTLNRSKLPSRREVLALLFHYKQTTNQSTREACNSTADDVLELWAVAHIPTKYKPDVVDKINNMFVEWEKLKKSKTKAVTSEKLKAKDIKWSEGLEDLLNI